MTLSVDELLAERSRACRLTPDRALHTFDEALSFLADRGMLTRTPDCALPSLFEACHEEPYLPGGRGFASWPKTKYSWAGELDNHPDCLTLKIHNGKNLLLHGAGIVAVAPICLSELERMEGDDPDWRRLLRHLTDAGPSTLEDVQLELGLKPKELRATRSPLERCGAIVARQRVLPAGSGPDGPDGHVHTSELARFDQVFTGSARRGAAEAVEDFLVAGVRAAIVAPEKELQKWFSWRPLINGALVDRLCEQGRIVRVGGDLIAAAPA